MRLVGDNGILEFDGEFVTITRSGLTARMTVGKGEKRFHVSAINAIQLKKAGPLVYGFIQFTLSGGNERRSQFGSQTSDARHDENSVTFGHTRNAAARELRDAIEAAMLALHQQQRLPVVASAPRSRIDELAALAALHASGALTDEEYAAEKALLLSGAAPVATHAQAPIQAASLLPPPSTAATSQPPATPTGSEVAATPDDASNSHDKARKATRIAGRVAGAVATGGLSEVGVFAVKKAKKK